MVPADVSDTANLPGIVDAAISEFGRLDIVVNNAGILRDRMLVNMSEEEWDAVIQVHLKGTFAPSRHAAAYWREINKKTGDPVMGRIINTTSTSGIYGNVGQSNYGAAKAGIAALTTITALEGKRYGVRANAMTLAGEKDGEVGRVLAYTTKNPGLIRVEPAYYHLSTTAFAKSDKGIKITSKEDLQKYRVGIVRGIAGRGGGQIGAGVVRPPLSCFEDAAEAFRVAGDKMDEAIVAYIKRVKPKKLILVHGDPGAIGWLTGEIHREVRR